MAFFDVYRGSRVLITGHTGFKGSWLAEWLLSLGAEVHGLALPPPTSPSLFDKLRLQNRLHHSIADVRDAGRIREIILGIQPDFVFHLAAQSLVRTSYEQPQDTYAINVMGTVHVLDALRYVTHPCVAVAVTTDKCYANREWVHGYREEDPLGGHDPYSSSKGAAEMVISAYRSSYFARPGSLVRLASARAGNVIGGGDWALDRIVPDCVRSLQAGESIPVRNKVSTRPWQHVLEPLSGYLHLAASIYQAALDGQTQRLQALCSGFNFGPSLTSNRTVAALVQEVLIHWQGAWEDRSDPAAVHEAGLLNLATDKAYHHLQWQPVWDFAQTVGHTISWYRSVIQSAAAADVLTRSQITAYADAARESGLSWA